MKVAFLSLGCKVNSYETNAMIQKFADKGHSIVRFDEFADVYIINTCTVTNMSDRKSRKYIREPKKINPEAVVVACGCYAQVASKTIEEIKDVDIIIGNSEKKDITQIVENYLNDHNKYVEVENLLDSNEYCEFGSITYTDKTRAVIKVQDGCDRFCTYCIIPYARGRVRSRKPENVIDEIKKIAQDGIQEVVITGIHIASYGNDFDNEYKLIDLLEEINNIDGIERIRLGSIEPLLITEVFVERLKKLHKICHHFHLSLQSGSDSVLKRMNRRYSTSQFSEVVQILRNAYDDVILTTDIIVGFPGETDIEFDETYEYLKNIRFYKMHIFKYSARNGTIAAGMKEQISGNVKDVRSKALLELSDNMEKQYQKDYIGKKVKVLFEERNGDIVTGHTSNYIMVRVQTNKEIENTIQEVKIMGTQNLELVGEL